MVQVDNEKALREALVSCNAEIEITKSFSVSEPVVITGRALVRGAHSAADSDETPFPSAVVLSRTSSFFDVMISIEGGDAVFEDLVIDGSFQKCKNAAENTEALFRLSAGSLTLDSSVRLKNSAGTSHGGGMFLSSQPGTSCILQLTDNIHIRSFHSHSADREEEVCNLPALASSPSKKILDPPDLSPIVSSVESLHKSHSFLPPNSPSSVPLPEPASEPSITAATFTKGFRITFHGGWDHTFPAVRLLPRTIITDQYASAWIPCQIPVKRGYQFMGWQAELPSDFRKTTHRRIYQPGEKITDITGDLTLTAVWKSAQ